MNIGVIHQCRQFQKLFHDFFTLKMVASKRILQYFHLHLHPFLAPFKCAVLPLSKKLGDKAMEIRNELAKDFMVDYDDAGSIGKRYRRQDEIGTPYCITVDFDTVGDEAKGIVADNCVTVRDRDTMEQVRMPISELKSYIESKIEF